MAEQEQAAVNKAMTQSHLEVLAVSPLYIFLPWSQLHWRDKRVAPLACHIRLYWSLVCGSAGLSRRASAHSENYHTLPMPSSASDELT